MSGGDDACLRAREAAWQHERASLLGDCARFKAERDTARADLALETARATAAERVLLEYREVVAFQAGAALPDLGTMQRSVVRTVLAELDAARADVAALTQELETAQARIDVLTARADRVRARLAGQETQTEHVITESARRMFEAYLAFPEVDIDAESDRARDLVRYFLNMARVFAETETQERARRAERRQS